MGRGTIEALKTKLQAIEPLADQVTHYPFLTVLADPIKQLQELIKNEYSFFLTDLPLIEDDLLDMKEDILDPVLRFMSGPPKAIYNESKRFLEEQNANFSDFTGEEAQQIKDILADAYCFKGNKMQQLKGLVDALKEQVVSLIEQEKQQALAVLQGLRDELTGMDDFALLDDNQQEELLQSFTAFKEKLQSQNIIAVIHQSITYFKENTFLQLLSQKDGWIAGQQKQNKKDGYTGRNDVESDDSGKAATGEVKPEYISKNKILVHFNKSILESEADIYAYINAIKKAYLAEVKQGKRVQI